MADAEVTRKRKFRAYLMTRSKKFGALLEASKKKFGSELCLENHILADAEVKRKRKFRAGLMTRSKKFGDLLVASKKNFGSELRLENQILSGDEDSDSAANSSSEDSDSAANSSSEESEFEDLYVPMHLVLNDLSPDVTREDIEDFFEDTAQAHVDSHGYQDKEKTCIQALVFFDSVAATKAALKLHGESLLGRPVSILPQEKGRMMLCITGFNPQLSENEIKDQIVTSFQTCGKVLKIFIPIDTVGLAYIYLDFHGVDDIVNRLGALDCLIGGVEVHHCSANLKLGVCRAKFLQISENESPEFEKLSDGDERAYLKKEDLVYMANIEKFLQTEWNLDMLQANSGKIEMTLTWRTLRPDTIPEPFTQQSHNCWSVALSRGYYSSVKMSGLDRPDLTHEMLENGVDARYQMSGSGIDSLKHTIPFMRSYCEDMVIHKRPKGETYEEYEKYEELILSKLEQQSVAVAIDLLPSDLLSYNGKGVFHPTAIDLIRRSHEILRTHILLLTGHGKEVNGELSRDIWELQESNGELYGDDGGFIKMARHQCIIKQVIEIKV